MKKHSRGFITLDFLFAFVLIFTFTMLTFAFSLSLSTVEIAQYITFASARTYAAGHFSEQAQRGLAASKYNQLLSNPSIAPLFFNGWFRISSADDVRIGDFNEEFPTGPARDATTFFGVRTRFVASVLNFNIPLLGATYDQEDGPGATISSFLIREPTFDECHRGFNEQRWQAIVNDLGYSIPGNINGYLPISDNGC